MNENKIVSIVLIIALLTTFAFFVKNNAIAKTDEGSLSSKYTRVCFNVNSKAETVPLTTVQRFICEKRMRPIRIWTLINGDTTAMFTVQKQWNLSNLNKIIAANILDNYKNSLIKDEKNPKINTKKLKEDKEIINTFSKKPVVGITALDFPYNIHLKKLFKTSNMDFAVYEMSYGNILPSPQFQWDMLHPENNMQSSNTISTQNPPDDSTWLPNYVSTDIRTLNDAEQTRYINQEAEWYDCLRLSYFWNGYEDNHQNHYATAYEQDTVFYKENNRCYVYAPLQFLNPVESWYSNFPDPYLDTRLGDIGDYINLTIGSSKGKELEISTLYYYTMYVKKGNKNLGYELKTYEEPCYYKYPKLKPRFGIFGLKSHVECNRWYVPASYGWRH